jgi:hypothetical protein
MVIDWSIRAGDLIPFFGFIIGGLSVIFLMRSDLNLLALRIGNLEKAVDKQGETIKLSSELSATMGRFDERLIAMQAQVDGLKKGDGFIRSKN